MFCRLDRNDISPELSRLIRRARNPTPVLRAMGTVFKSITEGNFNDAGAADRPIPWVNKKDGSPSNLQDTRTLSRSFHMEVGAKTVTVSNPMPYAAIHQFGGEIHQDRTRVSVFIHKDGTTGIETTHHVHTITMPARPFFPVLNGKLTVHAEQLIAAAGKMAME